MPVFRHGKGTVVLSNEFDLSAYLNSVTATNGVEVPETTTFGSNDRSYIAGHLEGTVSFDGLFDGSADAVDEILTDALGNDTYATMTVSNDGSGLGRRATMLSAVESSYEISSPLTDVVSVSGGANANGGLDYGVWLGCLTAITTTSTGTSVDNSASSLNGGVGHLHITANTRSTTTVAKVQHSTDNSVWVDLVTFTTIGSNTLTSQRVEVTGTVNRYVRALVTPASGTGSITFSIAFSRR